MLYVMTIKNGTIIMSINSASHDSFKDVAPSAVSNMGVFAHKLI